MKRKSLLFLTLAALLLALVGTTGAAQAQGSCALPARLHVGGGGRMIPISGLPNQIRSGPSNYDPIIGHLTPGGSFAVIGGPHCSGSVLWWRINYNTLEGWAAEGDGHIRYWLEPAGIVPPPPPPVCVLPNRLAPGSYGRVTPGLPNVVRTAPGTTSTGANSRVIGQIPGGGVFFVNSGPECGSDGRWWWHVNYNGLVGWTAEGEGYSTYWLEPWNNQPPGCALPARLTAGHYGRVTTYPNLPNRLRTAPNFGGAVIGQIPAGAYFYIHSGPSCADGVNWWQVSYNGVTGWTAEGQHGVYWLAPS